MLESRRVKKRTNGPNALDDDRDGEEPNISDVDDDDVDPESIEISPAKAGQRHQLLDSSIMSPMDQSQIPHTAKNASHLVSPSGFMEGTDAQKILNSDGTF